MAEHKYWFARRFPVGHARNAMAPVSAEGWVVVGVFVVLTAAGAGAFVWYGNQSQWLIGLAIFVVLTAIGGSAFVYFAGSRGDQHHTLDDYRSGRVKRT